MKLDRNIKDGRGKYALIEIRKLSEATADALFAGLSGEVTVPRKAVTIGEPDQFFVLKYKDIFTGPALRAYANAVFTHAGSIPASPERESLLEYCHEIDNEAAEAERRAEKIPS